MMKKSKKAAPVERYPFLMSKLFFIALFDRLSHFLSFPNYFIIIIVRLAYSLLKIFCSHDISTRLLQDYRVTKPIFFLELKEHVLSKMIPFHIIVEMSFSRFLLVVRILFICMILSLEKLSIYQKNKKRNWNA